MLSTGNRLKKLLRSKSTPRSLLHTRSKKNNQQPPKEDDAQEFMESIDETHLHELFTRIRKANQKELPYYRRELATMLVKRYHYRYSVLPMAHDLYNVLKTNDLTSLALVYYMRYFHGKMWTNAEITNVKSSVTNVAEDMKRMLQEMHLDCRSMSCGNKRSSLTFIAKPELYREAAKLLGVKFIKVNRL